MTIAAAYLTSEGVVVGADSTTTVERSDQAGNSHVVQLLNHAQKVYEVGEPGAGRFGLATWGAGSLGQVSHRTVAARASKAITPTDTVQEACDKFCKIVQPLVDASLRPGNTVGYFFGGIDADTFDPECWQLLFLPSTPAQSWKLRLGEARFAGAPQFFGRLFSGFDPNLPADLKTRIEGKMSSVPSDFDSAFDNAFDEASQAFANAGFEDLPVREAVDYVHLFLHATVKAFKFRSGPPACGGPIEIGFISTDRRFRWVCHKPFDTAITEHSGGNHG